MVMKDHTGSTARANRASTLHGIEIKRSASLTLALALNQLEGVYDLLQSIEDALVILERLVNPDASISSTDDQAE